MFSIEAETSRTARLYPLGETLAFAKVTATETWVYQDADESSARQTQYSFGEGLRLLAERNDFWLAQSLRDAYSGWVHNSAIHVQTSEPPPQPWRTRSVAPITAEADLKSAPIATLPPDACFDVDDERGDYLHISGLGWLHYHHAIPAITPTDIVLTAGEHVGRSYVWGGRGVAGLDCSALAQLCYRRAGHNIPRDADLQRHFLQKFHQPVTLDSLQAGDLIYLPGHVMVAATPDTVIHATAYFMQVVFEPLAPALMRYRKNGGNDEEIAAFRFRK